MNEHRAPDARRAQQRIPVELEARGIESAHADTTAAALLHEIGERLAALRDSGAAGCIDLRRTPLSPRARADLAAVLGSGEVAATVDALGRTRARETAVPGVWWVTHHDGDDTVVGELIEITSCPEILVTPAEELRMAGRKLSARIEEHHQAPASQAHIADGLARLGLNR